MQRPIPTRTSRTLVAARLTKSLKFRLSRGPLHLHEQFKDTGDTRRHARWSARLQEEAKATRMPLVVAVDLRGRCGCSPASDGGSLQLETGAPDERRPQLESASCPVYTKYRRRSNDASL